MDKNQSFRIALIICIFAVIGFHFLVPFEFANRGDFLFHYEQSAGLEDRVYAPAAHIVGTLFAYNQQNFLLYVLIIVWLVTPMALWHVTRTWQTVFFYFATQYPFFMLMTISQALAGVFLIGMFAVKNNYFRFFMVLGAAISHSKGGILVLIVWLVILFFENFDFKKFFPACGSLLGTNTPDFFAEKIPSFNQPITIATIGNFFVKIMPLPFLYLGLKQLWLERNFAPIVVSVIAFVAIFFQIDRTFYIVPLLIIPYSAKYCAKMKFNHKIIVYVIALGLIGLQVYSWIRVKTVCLS